MAMEMGQNRAFTLRIPAEQLALGLRPSNKVPHNSGYLIECKGAVGRDGVLQVLEEITKIDTSIITDGFPFPQLFVFTNAIIVCSANKIYEYIDGGLVLKFSAVGTCPWAAEDFFDYIYLSNGRVAIIRDANTGIYKVTTEVPNSTAICNYNGQAFAEVINITSLPFIVYDPWIERANLRNVVLNGIVWNGEQFCAVGGTGYGEDITTYITTSSDGITWTNRANSINSIFRSIAWGANKFVAVGGIDNLTIPKSIITSPNGVNWTLLTDPISLCAYNKVVWNEKIFCAVGYFHSSSIGLLVVTSEDGIAWTDRSVYSNPKQVYLHGIAWNGEMFCVVGGNTVSNIGYVMTSPDGITWTDQNFTADSASYFKDIAWNGEIFCAVCGNYYLYQGGGIYTSPDGVNWTKRFINTGIGLTSISWNGLFFTAVGHANTDASIEAVILVSLDGISWTQQASGQLASLRGVTSSPDLTCAVGDPLNGDALILTSKYSGCYTCPE